MNVLEKKKRKNKSQLGNVLWRCVQKLLNEAVTDLWMRRVKNTKNRNAPL